MYDDEPLDEMERRQRRDDRLAPYNPGIGTAEPEPVYEEPNPAAQHDWSWDDVNRLGAQEAQPPQFPAAPAPPPAPTQPYAAPQAAAPQPAFQPPAAPMAPVAQAPAPSVSKPPVVDEVTKILLARLNALKSPQDLQGDPDYQNAVRAYQVASLRGADRQRKALAERAAAGGTRSTGGFNVGVRGIAERQGENAAQYESGLAMDRLQQREAQLIEAIRMARAIGQDDIANQLDLQRLALQQELGRGDLALRGELGRGQLGLGYDNLGFSYADLITRANRDATLAGLRG